MWYSERIHPPDPLSQVIFFFDELKLVVSSDILGDALTAAPAAPRFSCRLLFTILTNTIYIWRNTFVNLEKYKFSLPAILVSAGIQNPCNQMQKQQIDSNSSYSKQGQST